MPKWRHNGTYYVDIYWPRTYFQNQADLEIPCHLLCTLFSENILYSLPGSRRMVCRRRDILDDRH
jgi:hypothetical protein